MDPARKLYLAQVKARGTEKWKFDGEPVRIPGPYKPTERNEQRAYEILRLRREAHR